MPNAIRLHRVLTATPEKIYRAFLEPEALAPRSLRALLESGADTGGALTGLTCSMEYGPYPAAMGESASSLAAGTAC